MMRSLSNLKHVYANYYLSILVCVCGGRVTDLGKGGEPARIRVILLT